MTDSIVIVGANLAGGRAAEALRRAGYEGRLTLVGDELWRPYELPPRVRMPRRDDVRAALGALARVGVAALSAP